MKVVIIKPDGVATRVTLTGYEELNGAVGGYIELINFGDTKHFAYLNEEGIRLRLPYNKRATDLCFKNNVGLMEGDFIKGNFIVVGPADEEGNDTDISEELADELVKGNITPKKGIGDVSKNSLHDAIAAAEGAIRTVRIGQIIASITLGRVAPLNEFMDGEYDDKFSLRLEGITNAFSKDKNRSNYFYVAYQILVNGEEDSSLSGILTKVAYTDEEIVDHNSIPHI